MACSKRVLCEGFGFRDPESVERQHRILAEMCRLSDAIRSEVDLYENQRLTDHQNEVLRIGFHIRRGDYRTYAGGEYCLDNDHWRALIRQSREAAQAEGRRFVGILCSNEDCSDLIGSSSDLVSGPGGIYSDLELLMRCHRIIAPPSTYSGWASFIAHVPLLRVDKSTTCIDPANFEVVAW